MTAPQGTDPEDVIKNAFGCFDEENVGLIHEDRLRELLTTIGDRFTDDEVDEMYREAPIKNGMFDYNEFTKILKHGAKENQEGVQEFRRLALLPGDSQAQAGTQWGEQ